MRQFFRELWTSFLLRFAKKRIIIENSTGKDLTVWCEFKYLAGRTYVMRIRPIDEDDGEV